MPDQLAALPDPALDQQVRDTLRIVEVREPRNDAEMLSGWRGPNGTRGAMRMPVWELTEPLPVDLCLEVEIHLQDTDEIYSGLPIVVLKNTTRFGYCSPRDTGAFLGDREGVVPLRIVLKPSRGQALSNLKVTEYYNGPPITSEVLQARIDRFDDTEENANP